MVSRTPRLRRSVRGVDLARIDQILSVVMVVVTELQMWLSPAVHDRVAASAAGAVLCGAVGVRRRWPLLALLAGVCAVSAESGFGGAVAQYAVMAIPAAILLFYGVGAFLSERTTWWGLGIGISVLLVQVVLTPNTLSDLFFEPGLLAAVPWVCGRAVRGHRHRERLTREYAEQLDADLELGELGAGDRERVRIARELHDVIGHCLSVVVLQAGGARMVLDAQPDRADAAIRIVEQAGHDALAELRHLLGLFADPSVSVPLAPQPGLDDLDTLVERSCAAGLTTELRVEGIPRPVSPALALCAYRIVQEALTNAMKYAAPARATVHLRWTSEQLALDVADDGHGQVAVAPRGGGHGVTGMRERAALHHGTVLAGPRAAGGYTVTAALPLTGQDT